MSEETLEFVCPETHEPVAKASDTRLGALRKAIESGGARRADGGEIPGEFDGAYLTASGHRAYLIVDGFPNFLIEERLELSPPLGAAS